MMMLAIVIISSLVVAYVVSFDKKTGIAHNQKPLETTIATVYDMAEDSTSFTSVLLRRLHRRLRIPRGAVF